MPSLKKCRQTREGGDGKKEQLLGALTTRCSNHNPGVHVIIPAVTVTVTLCHTVIVSQCHSVTFTVILILTFAFGEGKLWGAPQIVEHLGPRFLEIASFVYQKNDLALL